MEIWKTLKYDQIIDGYEISNYGNFRTIDRYEVDKNNVKRLVKGKDLKVSIEKSRNCRISLSLNNGKRISFLVKHLVAEFFVDNPNNYLVINHIDGDTTNNKAENLEWITAINNPKYSLQSEDPSEIWKPIKDFPIYEVSNKGRIKSIARDSSKQKTKIYEAIPEMALSPILDNSGYLIVGLCNNGRVITRRIHRIVAETFIENLENKPIVDHVDRNRSNNIVENLRWASESENSTNGSGAEVIVIFPNGDSIKYNSIVEASKATGYSPTSITIHCRRKSKPKNGYSFRWVNEKSRIGKTNRRKGNNFELEIVKKLKEIGYDGCVTSRSESKSKDNDKIDIVDKNDKLPINIQTKYTSVFPNFFEISKQCSDKTKPFSIIWKKYTSGENSPGTVAILPLDFFMDLLKIYNLNNNTDNK